MSQPSQFWIPPIKTVSSYITGLHMQNSLTQSLQEFIPHKGKKVTWYMCGPTVYDHSHLGHARTYIGFDTIKKIMRDYFKYDVELCMNITDIDDKIINRSNELKMDFNLFKQKWEDAFLEDMKNLNVELPEIMTRVTEYIPEIITFIEKVISNKFAYESNNSVYFDVSAYKKDGRFLYGILEPGLCNNEDLLKEGEGSLSSNQQNEKRSPQDFALWKKSKENEPKWASPWGEGRPGWHVECSAMAESVFEFPVDLHSGGVDLKFPHHTNELAQSEAFYNKPQWINYFIHTGHLHIEGLKMSKSLKNFITIKEILKQYTSNQLRLVFLLHKYDQLMSFSEGALDEAKEKEKKFKDFLMSVQGVIRVNPIQNSQKYGEKEKQLRNSFQQKKEEIHQAFQMNFNCERVIEIIEVLIKEVYQYMQQSQVICTFLKSIHDYIENIFSCMGLIFKEKQENNLLAPVVNTLVDFRDKIREACKEKNIGSIMIACDSLRDNDMIEFGIQIEDRDQQKSIWKFDDKERLLKERQDKINAKLQKEQEKQKKAEELKKQASIDPKTMFQGQYGQYDENGLPTHDKDGKEINKKLQAKLKKEQDKQETLYNQHKQ